MNRININRGTFLEKEELNKMQEFMFDNSFSQVALNASVSFGIVSPGAVASSAFKVTPSTTLGTINMNQGYILGPNLESFKVDSQIDFPVPNDNIFYWLKVSPDTHNYENGYVQVDTYGNVSGTVNFNGLVRGQSSGVPTCIRFVRPDGTEPLNNAVFQIVDIINNNTIVLSSGFPFQFEAGLRVIILGSIPMGQRFTEAQLSGLYTYGSYKLTLIKEFQTGIEPPKDYNEYYLYRLRNNSGVVTVLDERTEFWSLGGTSPTKTYTITVSPTPSDATVVMDGRTVRSLSVATGHTIRYTVSKVGYIPVTGTYLVGTSDFTIGVSLEETPEPTDKVVVTVKTSTGTIIEGFVSINDPVNIDKSTQTITVDQGTSVKIAALPASGYTFANWLRNGIVFNNVIIQDYTATVNTTFTAEFISDVPADYHDFDTVLSKPDNTFELFTVPVASGSGEYEGEMVKIN